MGQYQNTHEVETQKGEIAFMDYNVSKGELSVNEILYDGCQEQPVDLDFSLPDYCPDIQRILKCQVYPRIHMRNLSGDRLEVEGVASIKLLYLDEGKQNIRCCEHSSPFSCSFNLKKSPMNPVIFTKVKVEYINCRAVSPRKLDIHGAFSVCAKVMGAAKQEIVCDIPEEGLEQRKKSIQTSGILCTAQQQFTVSEVLEIGQGKPEAESVLRTDITAIVHDCKAIVNKAIVKGEVLVKVLYAGNLDNGELETMEYSIPVSQIVDAEGMTDDCTCDVRLEVLGHDIQVRTDSSGEDNLLSVDIKMAAAVIAYHDSEIQVVTDAYSTKYDLELDYKTLSFDRLLEFVRDTYIYKNTVEIGDSGVSRVIDVWNELSSVTAQQENDQILFQGKFNACILAVSSEGEPIYTEKMIDFEYSHDWSGKPQQVRCDPDLIVLSLSYRITGSNGVEIRAELGLSTPVYQSEAHKAICFVSADETKPRKKDDTAALTIYYADAGEQLWNIARAYCTSVEAIKLENDLADDVLDSRSMLLIPM